MSVFRIGDKLTANKHGTTVVGTVIDWRMKFGGDIQYSVLLDTPVQYRWRPNEVITTMLVKGNEVIV
jgi:hypothetical protein